MITLKAAVIAFSAVGAVAAGGVTWASVAQPEAAPRSAHGQLPAAVQKAKEAAPKTTPTCLPAAELAKKGKEAVGKGTGALPAAPQAPDVKGQPQAPDVKGQVPGQDKLPAAPDATGKVPAAKPGVPNAELPACAPARDARTLRKPDAKAPSAPKAPAVPAVPELNCDKLAPAVQVGGAAERAIMLPKGLKYTTAQAAARPLGAKQKLCSVTQKWVSKADAGTWITVERIKAPAQTTQQQLRQALKLPEGGSLSTVNGTAVWQAPGGHSGVLLVDPAGYALFVNGSPVFATSLQDVATKLGPATQVAKAAK